MQLTASKPDVYAWSVCRRPSMLRFMRRGLAAADLLARSAAHSLHDRHQSPKEIAPWPSTRSPFPALRWSCPKASGRRWVANAHAVIDEAKVAGVYVFGGGIDEGVPPVLVAADGAVAEGGYPWAPPLDGGFTVLELPSREEAVAWAARIAKACRCDQELRVFGFDPQS